MQTEIEKACEKFIKENNLDPVFIPAFRAGYEDCAKKSISKEKILNFIYGNHFHEDDLIEKINNGDFNI